MYQKLHNSVHCVRPFYNQPNSIQLHANRKAIGRIAREFIGLHQCTKLILCTLHNNTLYNACISSHFSATLLSILYKNIAKKYQFYHVTDEISIFSASVGCINDSKFVSFGGTFLHCAVIFSVLFSNKLQTCSALEWLITLKFHTPN